MKFLKKIPLGKLIILAVFLLVLSVSYFRLLRDQELRTYDLRLNLRPHQQVSDDIVIIEISDDTINNLAQWPLPRDFHASLVTVLKEFKVKAIVFDILFSEPTLYDEVFSKEIKETRNAYFALAFHIPDKIDKNEFPPSSSLILGDISRTIKHTIRGEGHINTNPDADGKVRKTYLFIDYNNELIPQLGLRVACDQLGLDIKKVKFAKDRVIIDDRLILPVEYNTSFLVNYPNIWKNSFAHFSYFEVLKSYKELKQGLQPKIDLSGLKDKICFIGLTAAGTSDLRATPLESVYPMVGLQASVLNSILTKRFIKDAGGGLNTLINLIILLLSLIICLKLKPIRALIINLIFGVVYFTLSALIFIYFGFWIDLFLPILIIIFVYLGSTFYRFVNETKKMELLENELDIARTIQKSFLPVEIKYFLGIDIRYFMQPAKFVAGDFYDIVKLDEKRLGVMIGDVSGKGVPASLIMAQTISLFRIFSRQYKDCSSVLKAINKEICGKFDSRFVTCLFMILDMGENKVTVSSAGHGPLLVYSKAANGVLEPDLLMEMPLGIMENVDYKDINLDFRAGDKIVLFTDGITEARNKEGREFGVDNLKDVILKNAFSDACATAGIIKEAVEKFSFRCEQHDDITLIVVNRK